MSEYNLTIFDLEEGKEYQSINQGTRIRQGVVMKWLCKIGIHVMRYKDSRWAGQRFNRIYSCACGKSSTGRVRKTRF